MPVPTMDELSGIFTYHDDGEDDPSLVSDIYTTDRGTLFASHDVFAATTVSRNDEYTTKDGLEENSTEEQLEVCTYLAEMDDDPSLISGIFTCGGLSLATKPTFMPYSGTYLSPETDADRTAPSVGSRASNSSFVEDPQQSPHLLEPHQSDIPELQATINRILNHPQQDLQLLDDDDFGTIGGQDVLLNFADHDDEGCSMISSLADELSLLPWLSTSPFHQAGSAKQTSETPKNDRVEADDGTSSVMSGSLFGGNYASVVGRLECRNQNEPIQSYRPAFQKNMLTNATTAVDGDNYQNDDCTYMSSTVVKEGLFPITDMTVTKWEGKEEDSDNHIYSRAAMLVSVAGTPIAGAENEGDDDERESMPFNSISDGLSPSKSLEEWPQPSSHLDVKACCEENAIVVHGIDTTRESPVTRYGNQVSSSVIKDGFRTTKALPRNNIIAGNEHEHMASLPSRIIKQGSVSSTASPSHSSEFSARNFKDANGCVSPTPTRSSSSGNPQSSTTTITVTRIVSTPGNEPRIKSVTTTTIRIVKRQHRRESRVRRILRRCWRPCDSSVAATSPIAKEEEHNKKNQTHHLHPAQSEIDDVPPENPSRRQRFGALFSCFGDASAVM